MPWTGAARRDARRSNARRGRGRVVLGKIPTFHTAGFLEVRSRRSGRLRRGVLARGCSVSPARSVVAPRIEYMQSSQPLRSSHAAAGAGRRARKRPLFLLPAPPPPHPCAAVGAISSWSQAPREQVGGSQAPRSQAPTSQAPGVSRRRRCATGSTTTVIGSSMKAAFARRGKSEAVTRALRAPRASGCARRAIKSAPARTNPCTGESVPARGEGVRPRRQRLRWADGRGHMPRWNRLRREPRRGHGLTARGVVLQWGRLLGCRQAGWRAHRGRIRAGWHHHLPESPRRRRLHRDVRVPPRRRRWDGLHAPDDRRDGRGRRRRRPRYGRARRLRRRDRHLPQPRLPDANKNHVGVDDLTQPCDGGVLGSLGQGRAASRSATARSIKRRSSSTRAR